VDSSLLTPMADDSFHSNQCAECSTHVDALRAKRDDL
jgi:hypothetical protein